MRNNSNTHYKLVNISDRCQWANKIQWQEWEWTWTWTCECKPKCKPKCKIKINNKNHTTQELNLQVNREVLKWISDKQINLVPQETFRMLTFNRLIWWNNFKTFHRECKVVWWWINPWECSNRWACSNQWEYKHQWACSNRWACSNQWECSSQWECNNQWACKWTLHYNNLGLINFKINNKMNK